MSNFDTDFRKWMDEKKLRAETVGKALDVSAQTVRNWRAGTIPKRKHDAIQRIMREWDNSPATQIGSRLSVQATDEQFRAWNRAANECEDGPMLIEDWARISLNKLAREYFSNPQLSLPIRSHLRVANDPEKRDDVAEQKTGTKYPPKGK
jgi:hypothetical protein